MKRALIAIAVAVFVLWLALPLGRAYALVAARPAEARSPADLEVEQLFGAVGGSPRDAWVLRAGSGKPAVVLVHGFKASREQMLPWARFLHAGGYNVLLFDTRGCGTRDERFIGLGATEADDVSFAVGRARGAFDTARIAVLGISLGAGVALLAAALDPRISAVIADSAWTDQDFTLGRLGYQDIGPLRVPLPPYGVAAVNAMVGADVKKARPLDVIRRISPRPVLLIHSADDDNATTPLEAARKLYEAAGQPKQLWVAGRGGHIGAINALPDEYRARVLAFLTDAFD